jgi:nucleoside-diphosphate-sugar epimerase
MMQQRKKVLITGGAGFVGSNLSRTLLDNGAFVDCADNLITGRVAAIQPLRSMREFRFLKVDITSPDFLNMAMGVRYDEIYHLACPTGVPNIKIYGEEMLRTCSIGTDNVLQVARAHNAKVVYASSAEVYGDPEVFPQDEEYCGNVNPVGPRSAYEEGKRFGETLARLYAEKYQVDAKIVRIFNTFGVGMSPNDTRVIPRFLKQIRERCNITVYGDGTQTRAHLYVADLISALLIVMSKGACGEVYNVGGERQLNIMDLIELLRELTPLPVEVEHLPHFIEDHAGRLPMTSKVSALGWRPRVEIRDGLRRMLVHHDMPVYMDNEALDRGHYFLYPPVPTS